MLPIVSLYKDLLESLGVVDVENGLLSYRVDDESSPVLVDGTRLALPLPGVLEKSPWDTITPFHPLSESAVGQQSPVLKKLRMMVNIRLTKSIGLLLTELTEIAADTDNHKRLTARQKEFLISASDADERMVKAVSNIVENFSLTGDHRAVNVYLKHGGKIDGRAYQRLATVTFPIFEEFDPLEKVVTTAAGKTQKIYEVFDIALRKKDKETIYSILKWIIPNATETAAYSIGSNSLIAPYFDALIRAYVGVANQLNNVADLFQKQLQSYDDIYIPLDWIEKLENLTRYRDTLPTPLPRNDGIPVNGSAEDAMPKAQQKPNLPPPQRPATATQQQQRTYGNTNGMDEHASWTNMVQQQDYIRNFGHAPVAPFAHLLPQNQQPQAPVQPMAQYPMHPHMQTVQQPQVYGQLPQPGFGYQQPVVQQPVYQVPQVAGGLREQHAANMMFQHQMAYGIPPHLNHQPQGAPLAHLLQR